MVRILLVVTVLALGGAAFIAFSNVQGEIDRITGERDTAQTDLSDTMRDLAKAKKAQEEAEQGADGGEEEEYGARPAKRRRMEKVVVGLTSGKKTSHPSMQETGNNPAAGFDLMKAQKEVWMDNLEEIKEAQGARKKKKQAKAMRHMAKRKF